MEHYETYRKDAHYVLRFSDGKYLATNKGNDLFDTELSKCKDDVSLCVFLNSDDVLDGKDVLSKHVGFENLEVVRVDSIEIFEGMSINTVSSFK